MSNGKYQHLYPVNNSGNGKLREIPKDWYFSIIQPSFDAVGDGNRSVIHSLVWTHYNLEGLMNQLNSFKKRNRGKIDHASTEQLIRPPAGYSIENYVGGVPIGKAHEALYIGPDSKYPTKLMVYDVPPGNVLYGNDKKPSRVWWK